MTITLLIGMSAIALYGLATAVTFWKRASVHWGWAVLPLAILIAVIVASAYVRGTDLSIGFQLVFAAVTILAAVFAGSTMSLAVLGLALPKAKRASTYKRLPAAHWVGLMERLAFTIALLLGLAEVAALIIAIKALGQYSTDKKNRLSAARVAGTLASVTWALLCFAATAVVGITIDA